jgi:hypothetical protein
MKTDSLKVKRGAEYDLEKQQPCGHYYTSYTDSLQAARSNLQCTGDGDYWLRAIG